MSVMVRVARIDGADPNLPLPDYATAGAAGADLRADTGGATVTLAPGGRALLQTGLRVALPDGYEMQVRPRSGLALKHGITLANAPGTVDSDYRGPLGVILLNLGPDPFDVTHGMRIAQAVVAPVVRAGFTLVEDLEETARGAGGFGSTGFGSTAPGLPDLGPPDLAPPDLDPPPMDARIPGPTSSGPTSSGPTTSVATGA